MNKYKVIKNKFGWLGIWQTKQNWKNILQIYWCFICTKLHPAREIGFTILGFVILGKHRALLSFRFYDWGTPKLGHPKMGMLNISVFYLPHFDFSIGNGKTWLYVRNEQLYYYRNKNKRSMPF